MKTTLIKTRKINNEEYNFFLNSPDYTGEVGVLGIELTPYISVKTPVNCFGYDDTILLNTDYTGVKKAYTLHRYLTPWILKTIEKTMILLEKKYC